MATVQIRTPHTGTVVRLAELHYELGIRCCAEKYDGKRCAFRSSFVSRGYPVCKHHTEPLTFLRVWA